MDKPPQYNEAPPGYPGYQPGYQQQGYPPAQQSYPPAYQPTYQGQGYIQQPVSSHTSNTTTVVVTQQPTVTTGIVPYVNDHMGFSIFTCLCCCPVIGIFAIMKSSEARDLYVAGDYNGALIAAQCARNIAIVALVSGIGITIVIAVIALA